MSKNNFCRMYVYNSVNLESFNNLTDENFNGAYLANSLRVDYFNAVNPQKSKIVKTKQYIQVLPFCIYFRKYSCLIKSFDDQISGFVSGGLINFWATQFGLDLSNRKKNENGPQPISMAQIAGVILVCVYLIAISVIMFIFELMSSKIATVKKVLDFFTSSK